MWSASTRQARKLLMDVNRLGLPAAVEYLDTMSPQFVADLASWSSGVAERPFDTRQ